MKAAVLLGLLLAALFLAGCARPAPPPSNVFLVGNARFTVVSDALVRMEWAPGGAFDDAPSFAFTHPAPCDPAQCHVTTSLAPDGTFKLATAGGLAVQYDSHKPFVGDALRLDANGTQWQPGLPVQGAGNLLGTIRTLDGVDGPIELDCAKQPRADLHCTYGLVARSGLVVVDDSVGARFDPAGAPLWPLWVRNGTATAADACARTPPGEDACGPPTVSQDECAAFGCCWQDNATVPCQFPADHYRDLWAFAHGTNYRQALADFSAVSGAIPLPPRYTFGVFFSRYWAYSDVEEEAIVMEYEKYGLPLDVLVTDMDWHLTFYKEAYAGKKDQAGQQIGWTGFTWDPNLFPEPRQFLDWCKSKGLRNTLNLHPASGIQPWEAAYKEMATAMGIDPASNTYVPLNFTSRQYMTNWMNITLRPLEEQGIDFWWLDWQQGEDGWTGIPGVNPTFWLNYIFTQNKLHWDSAHRPLILHRWGGLGNHRMQVGFSGDVVPSWSSLAFQPRFTATAANVGYTFWSHDIGGHTAPSPPELYTRWIQWGALSPVFRTHCTKNAENDRRIWVYPFTYYEVMKESLSLRAALVPYIYTAAYDTYLTGVGFVHPLYYDYPDQNDAYAFDTEYAFGDALVVQPVVAPADNSTGLAKVTMWVPPGEWVHALSGVPYIGPKTVDLSVALNEIPLLVRAGSVVPTTMFAAGASKLGAAGRLPAMLRLLVYPSRTQGKAGNRLSALFEDDGVSDGFTTGNYTLQEFELQWADDLSKLRLSRVGRGGSGDLPASRSIEVHFKFVLPPSKVLVDSSALPACPTEFAPYGGHFMAADEPPVSPEWVCFTYHGPSLSLVVSLGKVGSHFPDVDVFFAPDATPASPLLQTAFPLFVRRALSAKELLDNQWGLQDMVFQEDYKSVLALSEEAQRVSASPNAAASILAAFPSALDSARAEVNALSVDDAVKSQASAFLTLA